MKVKYLSQAWLVLLLALSFGAALASVEYALKDKIGANKLAATLDKVPYLVPGADRDASAKYKSVPVPVEQGGLKTTYDAFWAVDADSRPLGWVIKASGQGFADKIELLIGVDSRGENITGLRVLSQKETPGLGNKIEDHSGSGKPMFLNQFDKGLRADKPLGATTESPAPGSNKIQAVTGATISSRAVCTIVNEALSPTLREKLVAELGKGPALREGSKE